MPEPWDRGVPPERNFQVFVSQPGACPALAGALESLRRMIPAAGRGDCVSPVR